MPHEGSKAKRVLDQVRALLGVSTAGPACLTCGAVTPCQVCGGKQVRAENLIRALREVLRETPGDGLGPGWGRENQQLEEQRAGTFAATTLALSGRKFSGNESD
jgi:hypothetical protein